MRCYRTTAGLFVGTLAEAGPTASRIEIPDDKAGLINFVNALASAPRSYAEASAIAAADLTAVETFIQEADAYQLRSLMENLILRLRELAKGAGL